MPTVQSGAVGTIDYLEQRVVREMMQKIALLEPSANPVTTLMNNLEAAEPTMNAEPQHMEDELQPNIDTVSGAHTAAATALNVGNPTFYLVGDILHFPRTDDNARVTAAPGTNPLTVVRSVGAAPAAALVDGDEVWILGGAQREGDNSRTAINTLAVPFTDYCQIIRNSIEATGTAMATQLYDGSDFDYQFEKKLIEHKRQMELLMKFGKASRTSVNGEWLRTMGGLFERVQTNRLAVDGVLTEGVFDAFCEMGGQYGNDTKLLLSSPRGVRAINNFGKNRLVMVPDDESYGLTLYEYRSPALTVRICNDRELKGSIYGGCMVLCDPDYMVVKYLRGSPATKSDRYQGALFAKRIMNVQANDSDTRKDEIFSECCLKLIQERTFAIATGIQG